MKKTLTTTFSFGLFAILILCMTACKAVSPRNIEDFCEAWKFHLGDVQNGYEPGLNDSLWRLLDLPHDWSIEGEFSNEHPATPGGGALPGGIGWYRKTFNVPASDSNKVVFIEFDGIYRNSQVWINGRYLGERPYGYISFRYELTPFLKYGKEKNVVAVKVDNSQQPNSRWYSGSGIYRNVRLVTMERIFVDQWGTFITTSVSTERSAAVTIRTRVRNSSHRDQIVTLKTVLLDEAGKSIARADSETVAPKDSVCEVVQTVKIEKPPLWSIEHPHLGKAVSAIEQDGRQFDRYETMFGIRTFRFDSDFGFFLNGEQLKIKGVCDHHDLGCLGAAVNRRALERQLEILKAMGVNAIRTSHNPPAPELLDLCDRMGFIVMDEAFDMWKLKKTEYDYARDWDQWHERDLEDMVLRDRNHPSVFIWSIGNEIVEQWNKNDNSGAVIARELATTVWKLDPTRPVTAACNNPDPTNPLIESGSLDLIGYNYSQGKFPDFPKTFPGKKFIATETTSALATRGSYDMPSEVIRRWPVRWDQPLREGNPDNTCSSYDNCSAPWGSTHEETWKIVKKYPFLSGMFIWTGFDYLGEPTPYGWPSRSSYFGIVDLAGFPKDAYYMYQSEWTDKPVLHLFPHWNWSDRDTVDVWTYTNCDEVELYLNGQSQGTKKKAGDELHMSWRLPFTPGTLRAVGRTVGKETLFREVKTAGAPAKIVLEPDRTVIAADGRDLSFITVRVLDSAGTLVPHADNLVAFDVGGDGRLVGVDNGLQTSHESFKALSRKAFNGLCLGVIQSRKTAGRITVTARSAGLEGASVVITAQ
jgi:beta-galactosidase